MSRASRMYKDSPKLERDESGKMGVTKGAKESAQVADGTEGQAGNGDESEAMPMPVRHASERRDMHNRHETEHSMHKKVDKKEMHERHSGEMKAMHKRHEKEMMKGENSAEKKPTEGKSESKTDSGKGEKEIKKVEKE